MSSFSSGRTDEFCDELSRIERVGERSSPCHWFLAPPKMKTSIRILRQSVSVALSCAAIHVGFSADLYHEPFRPQYHFTPERNWMNDPNGMVYYEGEYHLFYQYNPFGNKWGHMSWGHAVSADLAHWKHLPLALSEENGVMIFSGSVVVDWKNSSGFGTGNLPPLVAIYTGHRPSDGRQSQCLAYSNDRGRTWTKFAGNPVIDIGSTDFRDPKVIWHEPTARWVMAVSLSVERKVRFYGSSDLKAWEYLSDFGPAGSTSGIWECPDLFPLPVEGRRRSDAWGLIVNVGSGAPAGGSGCQYFVGTFNGREFRLDEASQPDASPELVPEGRLLADFERDDYGDWTVSGEAFGSKPAFHVDRSFPKPSRVQGRRVVNSFGGNDAAQGTLCSPEFVVTHDTVNFLMAGGDHPAATCMNLLVDGDVVLTATGDNSGELKWRSWDVREWMGERARLEIVDRHSGGWGHIVVDHILLADTRARPAQEAALWADYGPDFYAAVSWSDVPRRDGRRLWLGWMSNWQYAQDVPTSPWRSAMSLPRALSLRATDDGLRLVQTPVRELRELRGERRRLRTTSLARANAWLRGQGALGELLEITMTWRGVEGRTGFGWSLSAGPEERTVLRCDAQTGLMTLDRSQSGRTAFHPRFADVIEAPWRPDDGILRMRVFVDASSVEVFAQDGETVLTTLIFPERETRRLEVFDEAADEDGEFVRIALDIRTINSIWK